MCVREVAIEARCRDPAKVPPSQEEKEEKRLKGKEEGEGEYK